MICSQMKLIQWRIKRIIQKSVFWVCVCVLLSKFRPLPALETKKKWAGEFLSSFWFDKMESRPMPMTEEISVSVDSVQNEIKSIK